MSSRLGSTRRLRGGRSTAVIAGAAALLVMTACTAAPGEDGAEDSGASASPTPSPTPVSEARVTSNISDGADGVRVDRVVKLTARDGTLQKVAVTTRRGREQLKGELSASKTAWTSTERLEPGQNYRLRAVAVDSAGLEAKSDSRFRTADLTLDQQTFPSIAPLDGETVGIGMPVIINFDVPVRNKASIERHLSVESTPHQAGSWHWFSDTEVRWRPKRYWKPGTEVTVDADVNSIPAGNGVFGQLSRSASFTVGQSIVSKVDVAAHQMKVYVDGALARTMPISAGKPGFITRSGTKVIIEKVRNKTMDAATIGISKNDPEYYNLEVEYAMRVTYSGEFLHAAPWSSGSQGIANVSHGCVGMSEDNAAWLFNMTKRGDVVEVFGSDRYMTLENGYGDWNSSYADYKQGSALS